jgi:hypothetical protein
MKIFVWTTIIISYLFILFAVLPVRLFLVQTTITNKLDKEIFVTPFGRVRGATTTTIPLEFNFPGISNPFNKNISLKPNETIQLYHDNDVCMFDGLLINKSDSLFKISNDKQVNNQYTISNALLTDNANKKFDDFTKYKLGDYSGFAFHILLLLYAPIMTVIILTRKFKK